MYALLLTTILACGNKEEDSGHIHISNDGPDGDAYSTPSCGPADGEAIRFVIGLESQEECIGTVNDDFGVVIELWENQVMESDTPVSLTTGSGLFYTGENQQIIAIDGEITVTFQGAPPGKPKANNGIIAAPVAALFAVSAATTPSGSPFPNFSGSLDQRTASL